MSVQTPTEPRAPIRRQAAEGAVRRYWRQGEPLVWFSGGLLTLTLVMTVALIIIVMVNGLGFFWPDPLVRATLKDGSCVMGELTARQVSPEGDEKRLQFKVGNRDLYGMDFRWLKEDDIQSLDQPAGAVALERTENGNFYGFLSGLSLEDKKVPAGPGLWAAFESARAAVDREADKVEALRDRMTDISRSRERVRLKILKLQYEGGGDAAQVQRLEAEGQKLDEAFGELNRASGELAARLHQNVAMMQDASGKEKPVPLVEIVRAWRPNAMSAWDKTKFYAAKIGELLTGQPREANTEGGLFPAIFGTVAMVLLMSLFCIPLGVIAAVYLREYAREGLLVRIVRIAVNNLAGVPSIVYGIFGLGFFVYGLGGSIDKLFFPERLPAPTFGTGGLLWASLTLALLTVPVVIVATEEALAAAPRGLREASLALGATKFQTLTRILLPMASPGIMTGLVLAIARAAGEVAPLMIVGVVKLAPMLPLDGEFPFLHLERKFMHLGFHIYDVGFQSPNVEAAKPMVYVTTLLLLLIVIVMSALAIHFRNVMRRRFATGAF